MESWNRNNIKNQYAFLFQIRFGSDSNFMIIYIFIIISFIKFIFNSIENYITAWG